MMERLGISGSVLQSVRDIYSNASFSVRTGRDSYTPPIPQRHGVKQGCPLSPILFNIVLEGLLKHLGSCDAGYTLAGGKVNSLAYADDICLVAADKVETQGLLNRCMEFVEWAGLKFNAAKCGTPCLVSHICRPFIPTSTGVRDHSITSCIYLVIGIALCNVMICN